MFSFGFGFGFCMQKFEDWYFRYLTSSQLAICFEATSLSIIISNLKKPSNLECEDVIAQSKIHLLWRENGERKGEAWRIDWFAFPSKFAKTFCVGRREGLKKLGRAKKRKSWAVHTHTLTHDISSCLITGCFKWKHWKVSSPSYTFQ